MKLEKALQTYFSFSQFRSGQKEILEQLFAKKDVFAVLPTSSGKSLIYQLYGILTNQQVIIISPLLSLMQDQIAQMRAHGFKRVIALTSTLSKEEKAYILQHITQYHFIFLSPEMLQNKDVQVALKRLSIGLFVIDEAHCISQWGYDFRPEYTRIKQALTHFKRPLILALTATATDRVIQDIEQQLSFDRTKTYYYIDRSPRKNIQLEILPVAQTNKYRTLVTVLRKLKTPCIIYFPSIQLLEAIKAEVEKELPLVCESYHSKKSSGDRKMIQQKFILNEIDLMFATSAFGMGVNKNDIRTVIHYTLPSSIEDYIQQIGRAGRDGQLSQAIAFYDLEDFKRMQQLNTEELNPDYLINNQQNQIGLSDSQQTMLEIIAHYGYSKGEAYHFLNQRLTIKLANIQMMYQLATTKECYYQVIQRYFTEQSAVRCHNCANCGTISMMELPDIELKRARKKVEQQITWQNLFTQLFKISKNSSNLD